MQKPHFGEEYFWSHPSSPGPVLYFHPKMKEFGPESPTPHPTPPSTQPPTQSIAFLLGSVADAGSLGVAC